MGHSPVASAAADGGIRRLAAPRSQKAKNGFIASNACPSTGLRSFHDGKKYVGCPGWVIDHIWPLCAGGEDKPGNMQWQRYAESLVKDRRERMLCRAMAEADRSGKK